MQALSQYERQSDEALVAQVRRGDREAFAALYERYFQGIYDFAIRTVRDSDQAGDVVQDTFTKAWTNLQKVRTPGSVKSWLYTIARNNTIDELRRRKRLVGLDEPEEEEMQTSAFTEVDASRLSEPEAVLRDKELVELVWTSAAALGPKEYSLLDLHLRQGLTADELATSLGLSKGNVYTMLSRLKDSLKETVTSTLLMRRGRRDCPGLDALLSELHAVELSRDIHRAIRLHLQECECCQESKKRYVSPTEIFASITVLPVTLQLKDSVWQRISSGIDSGTAGESILIETIRKPARWWRHATMPLKGAILVILGSVVGAALVAAFIQTLDGGQAIVHDPNDVRSTSHEVGRPSSNNVISIAWSQQPDALGYSVLWSYDPSDLPDADADLPGSATATESSSLSKGTWYFHLRTQGRNGQWTSMVHVGPFLVLVESSSPTPIPTTTPTLTPAPTLSPTPTPSLPVTPTSTSTPTSGPTPTQTPPPAITPTPTSTPTFSPTPTEAPPPATTPTLTPTPALSPTPTPLSPPEEGGGGR